MPRSLHAGAPKSEPATIRGGPRPVFRPMERADVDQVAGIEAAVASNGWSVELFASEFTLVEHLRHWLVAVVGDEVVGFGGLMIAADEGHVLNMATKPGQERRGIASRILNGLLNEAADRGVGAVTLEVRASNRAALNLYENTGFSDAGVRPGYYADGEDAVIMWLNDLFGWQRKAKAGDQSADTVEEDAR